MTELEEHLKHEEYTDIVGNLPEQDLTRELQTLKSYRHMNHYVIEVTNHKATIYITHEEFEQGIKTR